MRQHVFTKVTAFILAVSLMVFMGTSLLVSAKTVTVFLEDVTGSDPTTLTGEAKIKVTIKGAAGSVEAAQAAFSFSGDLQYKTITFLKNADAPAVTDPYAANRDKKLSAGIASASPMTFTNETAVFVLTFEGDAGDSVTVSVDNAHSFCLIGGEKISASGENTVTATAARNANEGKTATVKIQMDKVPGFVAGMNSAVTLKIEDEENGNTIAALLNQDNRDSGTAAAFTVKHTVIKGHTYKVSLSGIGYIPFEKEGETFSSPLLITNSDFIPGDINKDGEVDDEDKAEYDALISAGTYSAAADFNRDGYVDEKDNVFGTQEAEKTAPGKVAKPTVVGGQKQITVSWSAPDDGGSPILGYTVKYGTSSLSMTEKKEVSGTTTVTITNLAAEKKYFVQVAAKNAIGIGEFSELANAETAKSEGGGGGGGGGFTPKPGTDPVTPPLSGETFTDLAGYDWAKDSIYTLKNKGIISGVSETAFAPANHIKRGDFMLILTRMLGISDAFSENFADVKVGAYYYNAIGSAKQAGIATGDGVNFMPENTITRQDLITLAYRAFLKKGYISENADMTSLDGFSDKQLIAEYAKTAMASMVSAGIIKGAGDGVNPLGNATRAEVAVMCARLLALMN